LKAKSKTAQATKVVVDVSTGWNDTIGIVANRWTVDARGGLRVMHGLRLVAEFAPGEWIGIRLA
jgi:hypothetical protein